MTRPFKIHASLALAMAVFLGLVAAGARGQDAFANEPLRIASPTDDAGETAATPAGPSVVRVVASLGVVTVLIVALAWTYRRFSGGGAASGKSAVMMLSRTMLTPKHQVMVLRVGHRLVVVGDSGHGMNPLCEITEPAEVTAILAAIGGGAELQALRGDAFAASLRSADSDFEGESGEFEDEPPSLESLEPSNQEVRALIERVRGMVDVGRGEPDARSA